MTTLTLPPVAPRTGDGGRPPSQSTATPPDVCLECCEPTTWSIIAACPARCCDLLLCLDCAAAQGYEIH